MGSISIYFSFVSLQVERFSLPYIVQMGPSYCYVLSFRKKKMCVEFVFAQTRHTFSSFRAILYTCFETIWAGKNVSSNGKTF